MYQSVFFDTDVDAQVRYRATKVRTWSDEDYRYTETSYYMIHRGGSVGFEHVPVDGSSKMPDDLMESVEPYDYSDALDFQTAYSAGYFADKYDVTARRASTAPISASGAPQRMPLPRRFRAMQRSMPRAARCSSMAERQSMRSIPCGC